MLDGCFAQIKEPFLVMLPDIMPSLVEWMDDADPEVETISQSLIKHIESLSGESLSSYLE